MMKLILLLSFLIPTKTPATETFICEGAGSSYDCYRFYSKLYISAYLEDVIHVHEFSDSGTRNPYAPSDSEDLPPITNLFEFKNESEKWILK
jgi:hypothetical protein